MGNAIILGLPNVLSGSTATSSASASSPVSNILTDEPSDKVRISSVDPSKTWFGFEMPARTGPAYGIDVDGNEVDTWPIDALAIVNHNLTAGSAQVAVLRYSAIPTVPPQTTFQKLPPTSLVGSTNTTGTYTDVDEDPYGSLDANACIATTPGTPTMVHFGFATPGSNPAATAANLQAFYVAASVGAGAFPGSYGTLTIKLYEAGAAKATLLSNATVIKSTIYAGYWDASLLSTASGADVEVRIETNGYTDIEAVEWSCFRPQFGASYLVDWTTIQGASQYMSTYPHEVGPAPAQNTLLMLAASSTLPGNGMVFIRDMNNTSGYIQAGTIAAGPAFRAVTNIGPGDLVTIEDDSARGRTRGGQSYGSLRRRRRKVYMNFPSLTTTEGWNLFDRLQWRKGLAKPVFVSLYPDDATASLHTSIWGTIENLSPLSSPSDPDNFHTLSCAIVEKL